MSFRYALIIINEAKGGADVPTGLMKAKQNRGGNGGEPFLLLLKIHLYVGWGEGKGKKGYVKRY